MDNFLAQLIGLFGLACNVISFQQKKKTTLILCQLFGGLLFSVHFLMLGKYIGAMMNVIAFVRAIIFAREGISVRAQRIFAGVFIALCLGCYPLTFTVFKVEATAFNLIIEVLPVVAMCFGTVSFTMANAGKVRLLSFGSSPLWLVYNIIGKSIGGAICEILSLISIFVGMVRHDIKRKK